LIDTEHTLEPSYAARCGVQVDSLYISEPETAEEALEILEILAGSGSMDVVVVDSVTALTSRAELAASLGEATPASSDSLLSLTLQKLSAPLRRSNTTVIFTNQIRPGKNVVYHQLAANPSRLALKLHATLRLELRVIQPIKNNNQIIGDRIRVRVVKNQFAPCIQSAELDIIYNVGMIKTGEILDLGTQLSVVDIKGMVYSFRGMLLGVGRQSAINFLDLNRPVVQEIEQIVRQKLLLQ
jgi:recombination protein RecA